MYRLHDCQPNQPNQQIAHLAFIEGAYGMYKFTPILSDFFRMRRRIVNSLPMASNLMQGNVYYAQFCFES